MSHWRNQRCSSPCIHLLIDFLIISYRSLTNSNHLLLFRLSHLCHGLLTCLLPLLNVQCLDLYFYCYVPLSCMICMAFQPSWQSTLSLGLCAYREGGTGNKGDIPHIYNGVKGRTIPGSFLPPCGPLPPSPPEMVCVGQPAPFRSLP